MIQAHRKLPAFAALLLIALALLPRASADPGVTNEGGLQRATWDFSTASDYVPANMTLAVRDTTLGTAPNWRNYTTDAEFVAAEASATNVVTQSGLRLSTNGTNLVADGTFDLAPGPWTYSNGSTGQVTADRGARGRGGAPPAAPNPPVRAPGGGRTPPPR